MNQSNYQQKSEEMSQDLEESENEYSSLGQEEIQLAIRAIKKVHKIQKNYKLPQFRKSKNGNRLFYLMSTFFHKRKNCSQTKNRQSKEARIIKNKQKMQTSINKHKKMHYATLLVEQYNLQKQIEAEIRPREQSINLNPEPAAPENLEDISANVEIRCQICKSFYKEIHHFYGFFCPACSQFNMEKRTQKADLSGLTALVTGARIKIGYETALKLLRDGAIVYATSRFPNDTLLRYRKESDYENWKSRLHILQCDFVSSGQVTKMISQMKARVTKLDIIINNAAQTIVRPKQFYFKELEHEKLALEFPNPIPLSDQISTLCETKETILYPSVFNTSFSVAQSSQIDLQNEDEFGQPLDKRVTNTWVQKIEDVSLTDCYTTQLVNSIVPFHLLSQLKCLMVEPSPSWVINVTSMEGVFYKSVKQEFHPHTNMAKAALNMITRTCAGQFKVQNIFMNSVDTGWITNENPYHISERMSRHNFKCPLDCIDGAMRVLDPIYQGVLYKQFPYGKFLKDYKQSYW